MIPTVFFYSSFIVSKHFSELTEIMHVFHKPNRYLDQLGMAASYDTKTYCRQTLIGGNYGLLDIKTFEPHPDYYRLVHIMKTNTSPLGLFSTEETRPI